MLRRRVYNRTGTKLVTWSIGRCAICKKFLSNVQKHFCDKCYRMRIRQHNRECNLVTDAVRLYTRHTLIEVCGHAFK